MVVRDIEVISSGTVSKVTRFESYVWLCEPMLRVIELLGSDCMVVDLDQCYYGLQLPGTAPCEFHKKCTLLLGNIPTLKSLSQRCPRKSTTHIHDCAF